VNSLVEEWYRKIRALLPEDSSLVVTTQRVPRRKYLVSFRASALGETFISEVRDSRLDQAVGEAGRRLYARLELSPPKRPGLGDKVRRLFREAS